ncbi:mobilome CxxCx(11)CxxC protein [Rhodococcus sp. SGAir0479]|uniref:mobilome CxxCx(11)CxxC protein n=1 Tax=Rhodococcus sp. SGAir0479 TaxID=2567884 RepID=UPI001586F57C|nr:mobilome CxxCx(11)CxxC protein [Rhodococcus sp. SGAir0479]
MTSEASPSRIDTLRQDAWDHALHTYGTGYLFGVRARRFKKRMGRLTFAGIVIPVVVGAVAVSGIPWPGILPALVVVAGALGIPLAVVNTYALTSDWSGTYAHAVQSAAANQQLADAFRNLAKSYTDADEFEQALKLLQAQDSAQKDRDSSQQVTPAETRMGMRAALFERGKACAVCRVVPSAMKPSECGVCGDFPKKWIG